MMRASRRRRLSAASTNSALAKLLRRASGYHGIAFPEQKSENEDDNGRPSLPNTATSDNATRMPGKRELDVDEIHDERVDAPAEITAEQAKRDADHAGNESTRQRRPQAKSVAP